MTIKKRTVYDVANVSKDDPECYQKIVDKFSYDADILNWGWPHAIYFPGVYAEERLWKPVGSLYEQCLNAVKTGDAGTCKRWWAEFLKKVGVNSYTLEDVSHLAEECCNRYFSKKWRNIVAPFNWTGTDTPHPKETMYGYVRISNPEFEKLVDEIKNSGLSAEEAGKAFEVSPGFCQRVYDVEASLKLDKCDIACEEER